MLLALILLAVLFIFGLTSTIFKFPIKKIVPWIDIFLRKSFPKEEIIEKSVNGAKKPRNECQLKMVFGTFDKNKDGFITKLELRESFEKLGIGMGEGEVHDMVAKSDSNGDGLIEFDEFCDLFTSVGGDVADDDGSLREAFEVFDGDKDGMISVEELGFVLRSLGMREGGRVETCKEMIKKVDVDGDGMVSFDEFKIMMRSGGTFFQAS